MTNQRTLIANKENAFVDSDDESPYINFTALKDCVFKQITTLEDIIFFVTDNDELVIMTHIQECCEEVYIESMVGDMSDLVNEPILLADETTTDITKPEDEGNINSTATFYKLATRKGYVDIRWVGSSNGFYSETVDILLFPDKNYLIENYSLLRQIKEALNLESTNVITAGLILEKLLVEKH